MQVIDAVRTLLAVRGYRDEVVPDDTIRTILEAGRLSASARNRQPWHFIVVEDRVVLGQLADLAPSGPYIAGAAFAIVVAIDRNSRFGEIDASRAIQSMMLTAWEAGVGSNWVGTGESDEISALLGIPASYRLLSVIPCGYPDQPVGKGEKSRKPFDAVVSRGRFGEPFDRT